MNPRCHLGSRLVPRPFCGALARPWSLTWTRTSQPTWDCDPFRCALGGPFDVSLTTRLSPSRVRSWCAGAYLPPHRFRCAIRLLATLRQTSATSADVFVTVACLPTEDARGHTDSTSCRLRQRKPDRGCSKSHKLGNGRCRHTSRTSTRAFFHCTLGRSRRNRHPPEAPTPNRWRRRHRRHRQGLPSALRPCYLSQSLSPLFTHLYESETTSRSRNRCSSPCDCTYSRKRGSAPSACL